MVDKNSERMAYDFLIDALEEQAGNLKSEQYYQDIVLDVK
jgi:hypothetical protein